MFLKLIILLLPLTIYSVNPLQKTSRFTPNTKEEMLKPAYWLKSVKAPKKVLMNSAEIKRFNDLNIKKHPFLVDLWGHSSRVKRKDVLKSIQSYRFPKDTRYTENFSKYTSSMYRKIRENLNLKNLKPQIKIVFGVTVKKSNLRSFPTKHASYKGKTNYEFDRFQETEVNAITPALILHESRDKKWYFVKIYHYSGWILKKDIAKAHTKKDLNFINSKSFLVVTGSSIYSNPTLVSGSLKKVRFQMGTKLPLAPLKSIKADYHGQNPQFNFVVQVPKRDPHGYIKIKSILIPTKADVSIGYLNYTTNNLLNQLFKMAGERYSWGGKRNGRDCSKLIVDAFKTFGIVLPRNSSQLKKIGIARGNNLAKLSPGAILYSKGHVMVYLGTEEHRHYVLHSKSVFDNVKKDKSQHVFSVVLSDLGILPKGKDSILDSRDYLLEAR